MALSDGLADTAEMNDAGTDGGHGEHRDSTSEAARVIILVLSGLVLSRTVSAALGATQVSLISDFKMSDPTKSSVSCSNLVDEGRQRSSAVSHE